MIETFHRSTVVSFFYASSLYERNTDIGRGGERILNVQSFIDDPDSLRRKRQKFNNSPNSLVLRHVQAEAEKHAAMLNQPMQYNFNIIKPEPVERISPYGAGVSGQGNFPLYPVGTPSPQLQPMQTLRPQLSPGRTPSPMEYSPYNPVLIQPQLSPQYQPQANAHVIQQSAAAGVQQPFPYMQQPGQGQIVLNPVTPSYQEPGLQQLVNPGNVDVPANASNVLDMDSQQYSFDLNQLDSAELAVFGSALAENLSSGLSISDSGKVEIGKGAEQANAGESINMTDSFTRITNNTIQELCTLNSMYKPTREIDD